MKKYSYDDFLLLLAKTRNLLVYDDGILLKEYKSTLNMFKSYRYNNVNEVTASNVSHMLIASNADIVVIYAKEMSHVITICKAIREFDSTVMITLVIEEAESHTSYSQIGNIADSIVYVPFDYNTLHKKLNLALSAKPMMYEMSHILSTHKKFLDDTNLESYLDAYEQDVKIISQTLTGLVGRLKSGELGHELFYEIADGISVVSNLFNYHHYTAHLSSIFDEFVAFLRTYSFEVVDVSTLEGFDFLIEIIQDIINYINDFFINRKFSDVYVFEHSLHDSIGFMINHLTTQKKIDSDLEFF